MCYQDSGPTGLAFVVSSVCLCLSSAAGKLSALVAVRKHLHVSDITQAENGLHWPPTR